MVRDTKERRKALISNKKISHIEDDEEAVTHRLNLADNKIGSKSSSKLNTGIGFSVSPSATLANLPQVKTQKKLASKNHSSKNLRNANSFIKRKGSSISKLNDMDLSKKPL